MRRLGRRAADPFPRIRKSPVIAEALGIGQMQISRLEKRKDPRLSTMQRTVAAMGGHLTMIATFPDQEPVVLVNPLVEKTAAAPKKKRRA